MLKTKTLKNGLRFVHLPVKGTKTASVLVAVKTGSKNENKKISGVSHFLEHMLFKGTIKRPTYLDISRELDALGGEYNAFTSKEYTAFWAKAAADKLVPAADVIADMILNSVLSSSEMEKEKGVVMEEINMSKDDPAGHVDDILEELLYGDQPAGWDVLGTKESVASMEREDLVAYFKSQYGSGNMIVFLAGNFNKKSAAAVEKIFTKLKKAKALERPAVKEEQSSPVSKSIFKKTDQAHVSLGVRAFSANCKDEYILKVMAAILGGSLSSRLFTEIREKRGLAYYVRASAEFYSDSGYLFTKMGVKIDMAEEAIKVVLGEYKKLTEELVDEKELAMIKDYIEGRSLINMEASDYLASWHARNIMLKGRIVEVDDYLKKIKAVTAEDIRRVAREIFIDKNLNLAVIGPYEDEGKFKGVLRF